MPDYLHNKDSSKVVCCHGQDVVTYLRCGGSNMLQAAEGVDLSGGVI
ncbi:hypothetical protein [Prevotellamassilia timonensis]